MNANDAGLALLHDMSEFMGEQCAPGWAVWCITFGAEEQVIAHRERASAESSGRGVRFSIVVDAYPAEIVAESRLEILACLGIEEATGRSHDTVGRR